MGSDIAGRGSGRTAGDAARPMRGRVCMVTGATAGIGMATTEALARLGATIVAVGRNREKGARLVDRLRRETGNTEIEFLRAELSLQPEVQALAAEVMARHRRLHVLVNNVGGFFLGRSTTPEGFESSFALNYLNVFLLTRLLEKTLQSSAPARVVNVSSDVHRWARLDLAGLAKGRRPAGIIAYAWSKQALTSFTYESARRLDRSDVTVNALHPGFVASNLYSSSGPIVRLAAPFMKRIGRSVEEGADTAVYLASSAEVEGVTGKYFVDRKPVASSPATYDEVAAKGLWDLTERMVGLT